MGLRFCVASLSYPALKVSFGEGSHNLPIGTAFRFGTNGILPVDVQEGVTYYIIAEGYTLAPDGNVGQFEFSLTKSGSAITGAPHHHHDCWIYAAPADITYEIGLEWSDDGGHTWSNKHMMPIGNTGQYNFRSIWRRMGRSRERIFRLTFTLPVKAVVLGAYAEIEETAG